MGLVGDILNEWENGCFYTREYLSEAFVTFLAALPQVNETPDDSRFLPFLEAGYRAYLEVVRLTGHTNSLVHTAYHLARLMHGGAVTRSQARTASEVTPDPPNQPVEADASQEDVVVTPDLPHDTAKDRNDGMDLPEGTPQKRSREDSDTEEDEEGLNDDEGGEDGPTIEVIQSTTRYLRRFQLEFREEIFCIKNLGNTLNIHQNLVNLFDTMLERQKKAVNAKKGDSCIVEVRGSESLATPVWFSLRLCEQISGQVILDKIAHVLNSNQSFMTDGTLHFSYIHVPQPEAGGNRTIRPNEDMEHFILRKTQSASLFDPKNTDKLCLTRCAAVCMAYGTMKNYTFNRLKNPKSKTQTDMAKKLCADADIDENSECGIDEIKKLQNSLPDHRIIVFVDRQGKEIIFHGPISTQAHPRKNIYLLLHEGHFYGILHILGAFGFRYFCENCLVTATSRNDHKCFNSCWRCGSTECHDTLSTSLQKCKDCCRYFAGDECFKYHVTEKVYTHDRTTCQVLKFCSKCEKTVHLGTRGKGKAQKHKCGTIYCTSCNLMVSENHYCYVPPWEPKPLPKNTRQIRIYFDIETSASDQFEDKNNWMEHKPNVLISHQVCNQCEHIKELEHSCLNCGEREQIFESIGDYSDENVVGQFLAYLKQLCSEEKTEIICFSHNGKAFDTYFILHECLRRKMQPQVILNGAKIISLKIDNIQFKDSLMFVPQKLSSLPKAFGLDELRKGWFPHLMNRKQFYSYNSCMPDKELYCTSTMTAKEKQEFEHWYQEQVDKNYMFNFKYEILTYCQSDVDILRQAMESFRTAFMEISGFCPLYQCIASALVA
ncbi:uncharacterized protein LOC117647869 [Thrips palmi]|uniref:DNA-directed DNA polymerase n=1 Tax=Thrips palmi TaxID=161013 RepID=A0A6P8Z6V4_THRPL|nr:uncharacterized protein LOC117647869 [Thrips palmi]